MIKGDLTNNADKEETKVTATNDKANDNAPTTLDSTHTNSNKIFSKFTIKDIVFLAIMSAVLITTCAVMAIISGFTLTIFAIGQVATGFQLGLFITIGLIKVRKPLAMTFMMMCMGGIMVMMSPIMFLSNVCVTLVVELVVILIFKGYKSNKVCVIAGASTGPLSIITPTIYNLVVATEGYTATDNLVMVVVMTAIVIAISLVGALVGYKIATELEKAGALKK